MKSNYKPIGDFIRLVDIRNKELKDITLVGVSINKKFIPSVANIIGSDMTNYKIIKKNQFACSLMQVRRDGKIPVALFEDDEAIISQAYPVFEIVDTNELLPQYLMMWMTRSEFDREACFYAVGGVRGSLEWEDFCSMKLPVPTINKQKEIIKEYHTITDRIKLNESLNQKLEDTAQSIYKEWFVNFDSTKIVRLGNYIDFNPKHTIKKEQLTSYVEMADVYEDKMSLKNIIKRPFTSGSKFKNKDTLLARITPCLENGKTAFVTGLNKNEIAFGSTEFIVMRAKKEISPYWVYCLAREENFRSYAISSMVGSSGRQRVHSDYLKDYEISIDIEKMNNFHITVKSMFEVINFKAKENKNLEILRETLLSKIATIES
jgi:type I restriction enzyme S subunit